MKSRELSISGKTSCEIQRIYIRANGQKLSIALKTSTVVSVSQMLNAYGR